MGRLPWVFILIVLFSSITLHNSAQKTIHEITKFDKNTHLERTFHFSNQTDSTLTGLYNGLILTYNPDSVSLAKKLVFTCNKSGVPEGDFYLEKTLFKVSDSIPGYENFLVLHPINGNTVFSVGELNGGIPINKWYQYHANINAVKTDTTSKITVSFDNKGEWSGNYSYSSEKLLINGHFDNNLFSNIWKARSENDSIQLRFANGFLEEIIFGNRDSIKLDFADSIQMEETSLRVLISYLTRTLPKHPATNEVIRLLDIISFSVEHFIPDERMLLPTMKKPFPFDIPQIKLPVYQYTEQEMTIMRANKIKANGLLKNLDSILTLPEVVLACHNNVDVANSVAALELAKRRLKVLECFLEAMISETGKFLNPDKQISLTIAELNENTSQSYECQGTSYTYTLERTSLHGFSGQEFILNQIQELHTLFTEHNKIIHQQINHYHFNENVKQLRANFSNQIQLLDSLKDEIQIDNPNFKKTYTTGFDHFKTLLANRFSLAIQNDDMEKAILHLEELNRLILLLGKTDSWNKTDLYITDVYHYMYLDPNTFVERKEPLYDRLFKAYQNKLMPFVLRQLSLDFNSVSEFEKSFDNIFSVQKKMIDILDENPKKLNSKIKSRDNADKITEKLDLILN